MPIDRLNAIFDPPAPAAAIDPLVSILIPCVGQLEYTKLCVPSVLKYSRRPFELIFLDIGSLDGTAEYLAGLKAADPCRVEWVRTLTDLEIAGACRQALELCHGEYLVLLNNDTVVTPSWLTAMTSLAKLTANIGLVGPMSNYAAPPQLVESVPYRSGSKKGKSGSPATRSAGLIDPEEVAQFGASFHREHKGQWMEVERLAGFCLLIKRSVYKVIDQRGELDKWTDLSLFDTDVLSIKARQAGFGLALCRDLFVHHFGTRTFAHGAPAESSIRAERPRLAAV